MTDESEREPGISIIRTFDASPEAVFAAWTEATHFAHWFGGAGTTVDTVSMDVRPGGAWSARMVLGDGGTEIPWRGTYVEVEPPRRLVLTLTDRPGDQFELVTVDLLEVDGRTEMRFTQTGGHMDAAGYRQAEEGWQAFFVDLEALLATVQVNGADRG